MARVLVTFLGIGNPRSDDKPGYYELDYALPDGQTVNTMFAQRAIVQWLTPQSLDRIVVLMTPESEQKHWRLLHDELRSVGVTDEQIIKYAKMSATQSMQQQWTWFRALLEFIDLNDHVTFDFTHGFRSVPIIFSTAISFLQKVKRFHLEYALYGYMEDKDSKTGRIIDMAPFYAINQWADAVSALVDSADASKLAALAENLEEQDGMGFKAMANPDLIAALRDLTSAIRDVDMNAVGARIDRALTIVRGELESTTDPADEHLLHMVIEKFGSMSQHADSTKYDQSYFDLQLVFIELLLKHDLNMQAYTVMRETVASIGMLGAKLKYRQKARTSSDGRGARRRWAEMFVGMCIYPLDQWKWSTEPDSFPKNVLDDFANLQVFWRVLMEHGIAQELTAFVPDMIRLRNGLNHGWTAGKEANPVGQHGQRYLAALRRVCDRLHEQGLFVE